MSLQEEIDGMRSVMHTDDYSMSIGELMSLYQGDEIDIHPEFQRFFRWTPVQKTRLIESILLGIPIPPIFVAQRSDGVWDVVDGVQRLSTILQFVGLLSDEDGKIVSPLTLEATRYLPSLNKKKWDDPNDPKNSFTPAQKLFLKRSKLDFIIVLRESSSTAKYELFQRLNSGSPLSQQEMRNCILVMENRKTYSWIKNLATDQNFKECMSLTDRAIDEQYDLELLLRFMVFRTMEVAEMKSIRDIGDFLTDRMLQIPQRLNFRKEEEAFRQTFDLISRMGSNAFRRYDRAKKKFSGGFLLSTYEVIALGIGYHYAELISLDFNLEQKVKNLWSNKTFAKYSGPGVRASSRIPILVPLGRELFAP